MQAVPTSNSNVKLLGEASNIFEHIMLDGNPTCWKVIQHAVLRPTYGKRHYVVQNVGPVCPRFELFLHSHSNGFNAIVMGSTILFILNQVKSS